MAKRRQRFMLQAEVVVSRLPMVWADCGMYTVPESPCLTARRVEDRVIVRGTSMCCEDAISFAYALLGAAGAEISINRVPRRKARADA